MSIVRVLTAALGLLGAAVLFWLFVVAFPLALAIFTVCLGPA